MISDTCQILELNTVFGSLSYKGLVHDKFRTTTSFLDYDAVLIDTCLLSHSYGTDYSGSYKGKRMISENESHRMIEEFERTKSQLVELLKQGKNVFVLMGADENCYIYTGQKEYSGTGKNTRATNIVTEYNVFSFLPIDIKPIMVSGEKFDIACQSPYSAFFQATKDMSYYEAYFDAPKGSSLLKISNSDKTVSAVFECYKGKIIILPYPYGEEYFNDEKDWKKQGKKYLNALFELNNALTSHSDSYVLPIWTQDIKILDEKDEEEKIEDCKKKLKSIEAKIKKHEANIKAIQQKKILLTASGTPLEEVVKETLKEIGFALGETETGRSDIVASYNGTDIVAEIKGVTKSAAEKHAAQLEKWVAQFIEEKERAPKAMLIVNGFCDKPLSERHEEVFPEQMIKYCTAREHALISTTQLLCLYIEIKQNPACAPERISELLSCVGRYQRYKDFENYLKLQSEEV